MKSVLIPMAFSASMLAGHATAADTPVVVTSIKPLHSLVASVMQGVGTPELIVDGSASPHTYAMKPSNARALQNAKVVFWMGPGLETFLTKPLSDLGPETIVAELDEAPNLVKLKYRAGGPFEADSDEDHDSHGSEDQDHAHDQFDTHLWLDPMNAKAMVAEITTALSAADPRNALAYQNNAAALSDRIDTLDQQIKTTVAPVANKPFIVFHDAYQYFEHRYGVKVAGSITVSPETLPGAERLSQIHTKITSLGATCVFAEPQFQSRLIDTALEGTDAKAGVLDPEGTSLPAGPDLYFTLMQNIAQNLKSCLSQEG
ncbi:zinc ABC transporter substrate-binding protein [Oryzifoliimicrobium ureilyticus]|uniref:zinc ABC transporter substrate-binding protein n=1 Tax=Oryzifoliimicrobium ureilyticus TaxID=3113724 RepID=UPI0030763064